MATSTIETTSLDPDSEEQYDNFLDDPYNMAMYIVLPTMVIIYGGCCFIYCMAKLHRYCRRKARRRARLQLIQKECDSDDDNKKKAGHVNANGCNDEGAISVVDLTDPEPAKPPPPKPAPKPVGSKPAEPGYTDANPYGGNLQQQMQHLDDQLKAAFKLITDEPKNKSLAQTSALDLTKIRNPSKRDPVPKCTSSSVINSYRCIYVLRQARSQNKITKKQTYFQCELHCLGR